MAFKHREHISAVDNSTYQSASSVSNHGFKSFTAKKSLAASIAGDCRNLLEREAGGEVGEEAHVCLLRHRAHPDLGRSLSCRYGL